MNTRKITKYMLLVLVILLLLICLSLFNKKENDNTALDDVEVINGSYVEDDEIILNDFSNLFSYFSSFEEGTKSRDEIINELKNYGTPVKNFKVMDDKLDNGMLTFTLISMEEEHVEEYMVSITNDETIIARSR